MSMWEPFSDMARRAIVAAQEAAKRLGQSYIGTEHMLLGITAAPANSATQLLTAIGVDVALLRQKVEALIKRGKSSVTQSMVFTPRAKRVIELAFEQARELDDRYIGTDHLLFGIIREESGTGARVLSELHVELAALKAQIGSITREQPPAGNVKNLSGFSNYDHVQLAMPAGKENEARAFYVDALGMAELPKPAALQSRGGVWFISGIVQLHLGVDPDFRPAKKAHPALRCNDFAGLMKRLHEHGVEVQLDADASRKRAYVHDPFGNRIELIG